MVNLNSSLLYNFNPFSIYPFKSEINIIINYHEIYIN